MSRWVVRIICAAVAFSALGEGVKADTIADCRTASSAEARLAACSAVIAGRDYPAEQKAIAYRNRGRAHLDAGALDSALADLGEAVRLNPTDYQAFTYRALVKVGRNDLDGAIADYSEVVRLRPASAIGYSGRGHAHLVKGNAKLAIADFTEAIRLNPKSPSALNNRGLAHRQAGDLRRAFDDYTAAIMLNPIYALAYNNRGYVQETEGRRSEAIEDYRRALMIDPALVGARDGLNRLGAHGALAREADRLTDEGKALVDQHCKGCHAVDRTGVSPNSKAPAFRTLHARHPMQALREPLTRGIAAPHDTMPKFRLSDAEVDKIVAYINSLGAPR